MTRYHPLPAVAEALSVDVRRIKELVRSGELPAVDIAPRGAKYRKLRVAEEALEIFLTRRSVSPPAPAVRQRRRRDEGILHFNYD